MKLKTLFEIISTKLEASDTTTLADCYKVLADIEDGDIEDWETYCSFFDTKYTRNLIFRDNFLDCYLLCWLPGQATPYHYHPSRGCIYRILEGELVEIRNINNGIMTTLTRDMCGYIDNEKGGHIIKNESNQPAVSLHFYAPAKYYD